MHKFISVCLFSLFLTLGLQAADASADAVLSTIESESTTLVEEPGRIEAVAKKFGVTSVSYTHLTLPTIYSV